MGVYGLLPASKAFLFVPGAGGRECLAALVSWPKALGGASRCSPALTTPTQPLPKPPPPAPPKAKAALAVKLDYLIQVCESAVVLVVGFVALLGAGVYIVRHGFAGTLDALDQRWKGVLVLSVVLFHRTLRLMLERIKGISPVQFQDQLPRDPELPPGEHRGGG